MVEGGGVRAEGGRWPLSFGQENVGPYFHADHDYRGKLINYFLKYHANPCCAFRTYKFDKYTCRRAFLNLLIST